MFLRGFDAKHVVPCRMFCISAAFAKAKLNWEKSQWDLKIDSNTVNCREDKMWMVCHKSGLWVFPDATTTIIYRIIA